MGEVLARHLHQVGDQVVAPLELHVDLTERVSDGVLQAHQAVVGTHGPEERGKTHTQQHPDCHRHAQTPFMTRWRDAVFTHRHPSYPGGNRAYGYYLRLRFLRVSHRSRTTKNAPGQMTGGVFGAGGEPPVGAGFTRPIRWYWKRQPARPGRPPATRHRPRRWHGVLRRPSFP